MRREHREDSMKRLSMEVSFRGQSLDHVQSCLDHGLLRMRMKENEYESLVVLRYVVPKVGEISKCKW